MQTRPHPLKRRSALPGLLLALLLFRAYVPLGFMPAAGTPFLLELCPEAAAMPMNMAMAAHHHHGGSHGHFEHCPFGGILSPGPVADPLLVAVAATVSSLVAAPIELRPMVARTPRAHPARGPPFLV
jgi:hypothetical protein